MKDKYSIFNFSITIRFKSLIKHLILLPSPSFQETPKKTKEKDGSQPNDRAWWNLDVA